MSENQGNGGQAAQRGFMAPGDHMVLELEDEKTWFCTKTQMRREPRLEHMSRYLLKVQLTIMPNDNFFNLFLPENLQPFVEELLFQDSDRAQSAPSLHFRVFDIYMAGISQIFTLTVLKIL
jgi:hypothetical protein